MVNPLGIDVPNPALSWEIEGDDRNIFQSAYQLIVYNDNPELDEKEVWNSGKISSNEQLNIKIPFETDPFTRYFWKVKIWNQNGKESLWSEIAWFETAFTGQASWQAKWISDGSEAPQESEEFYEVIPAPLFRKNFEIEKNIKKARLYISGLGYYSARINGKLVSDDVLHPAWTQYANRVMYSTYDVSTLLQNGDNVMGIQLGNGWYNPLPMALFRKFNLREFLTIGQPVCIAELHLEYSDGSRNIIVTDESWKTHIGPLLKNNIYLGEVYDARKEQPGWEIPGFSDEHWQNASLASGPKGKLLAQMIPPNRITKTLKPKTIQMLENGVYIVDFGQNFAGWLQLQLRASEGDTLTFKFGELLHENGRVNGYTTAAGQIKEKWGSSGGPGAPPTAYQEGMYICKEGDQTFQHQFAFHGFQFVEISGYPGELKSEDITGIRINADLQSAGYFESSDTLLNRIQEATLWTFLSNVFSVQSDCPAREKFGYGGDIVTAGEAFIYNFDMVNFYKKTVIDFEDDARESGGLTETAPYVGIQSKGFGDGTGPVGWQLAHPFILKQIYLFYGDKDFVNQQYPVVKSMVEFLKSKAVDNLILHCIGDHECLDTKPEALNAAAFYYQAVSLLSEFATITGKNDDAETYSKLASDIKKAFINKFYRGNGHFDQKSTQITQSFALYHGLFPQEDEEAVLSVFLNAIEDKNRHFSTGIFSTKYLFDVLRHYDKNNIAYEMVTQNDFPGFKYMFDNGATTLWERWAYHEETSWNHPMFGSVSEWFFRGLGGINPSPDARGFDKVHIRPLPVANLDYVKTFHESVRGKIVSEWSRIDEQAVSYHIEVPGNMNAEIYIPIPANPRIEIFESGNRIYRNGKVGGSSEGVKFLRNEKQFAIFQTGSGKYQFQMKPF
ncbi:MAG: family 78 glycoside hydrolase catalytic domain [Cyclobacteriaceae bacterium]|nr:family 78 glycoside hydrolase catalytic domain [Cyclobacteriaceae bacterium]